MAKVVVYSSANCAYCIRAKQLLESKGVTFEEIRVDVDDAARAKMMELSGRRTVHRFLSMTGRSVAMTIFMHSIKPVSLIFCYLPRYTVSRLIYLAVDV